MSPAPLRWSCPGAAPGAAIASGAAPPGVPGAGGAAVDIRGGVLQEIPYTGMRRMIGEHMEASSAIAPMVTYTGMADVQKLKELVAQINATRPDDDRVSVTAATVKAVAHTLERIPLFNSSVEGDVIKLWRNVNIGVAVAIAGGLIVPVIRQANLKRLGEIAGEIRELAARARENKLLPDDISGGTFTVSTLGPIAQWIFSPRSSISRSRRSWGWAGCRTVSSRSEDSRWCVPPWVCR